MPHQITVTAPTGPARQLTATVVPNVLEVVFLPDSKLLRVRDISDSFRDYDLAPATTVTCTIVTGNYSFVVS